MASLLLGGLAGISAYFVNSLLSCLAVRSWGLLQAVMTGTTTLIADRYKGAPRSH